MAVKNGGFRSVNFMTLLCGVTEVTNLDFILWMTLFPLSMTICDAIRFKYGERKQYSDDVNFISSCIMLALWLGIGYKLW
jgi:hypothetical protein